MGSPSNFEALKSGNFIRVVDLAAGFDEALTLSATLSSSCRMATFTSSLARGAVPAPAGGSRPSSRLGGSLPSHLPPPVASDRPSVLIRLSPPVLLSAPVTLSASGTRLWAAPLSPPASRSILPKPGRDVVLPSMA